MKVKVLVIRGLFFLAALFASVASYSQCAMCRATAESDAQNGGGGVGEGLNTGIIYLMGIPYLLLMTVAILFYRKKILAFFKA